VDRQQKIHYSFLYLTVSIGQWKQFDGYGNDSRFANIVHHLPSFVQSSKSKNHDTTLLHKNWNPKFRH
jgi:hypothetical protein